MRMTSSQAAGLVVVVCSLYGGVAPSSAQVVIETQQIGVGRDDLVLPGFGGMRGQMKTGTGRITGRVLSAENGGPLRRAQVRIMAPEIGAKTALTDVNGQYEFRDLPAGRFTMNASKSGYVSVQYGQTRPFESGRPIELADKQVLTKADIVLPRGGVISGRVLDEFGEPIADAMVTTMRQAWSNGRRRLLPAGRGAQTNDLGQYRLYGLPPGEYYISATLRNTEAMIADLALVAGPGAPTTGSQPSSGYAATYFPGTSTPANAERIAVNVGQEAQNADFALMPVRLARISGTIMSSEGKPVEGAMVTAAPLNRPGDVGFGMMGSTGRSSKDGQFTISNVAPGDYTLNVQPVRIVTSGDAADGGAAIVNFRATIGGMAGGDAETASLPIAVAGEDLTNLLIVTAKGGSAIGRLIFEGSSTPPAGANVRISAPSADSDAPPMPGGIATVTAEGTFELKGLSGRRLIRAANLPSGWTLKAVTLNGNDITDVGTDFKAGQELTGLEVVVTAKATTITGSVSASNGSPAKDYTVVIFSDDQQRWQLPVNRWVTGARPNQDGRFQVRNMPPGGYYAIAVDYVEQGAWGDPELLERFKARAKAFTLAEGGTETLDLKIVDQN